MELRAVSTAATLRVTAIVFAVLVALRFLWIARAIFIVAFLGVLLGLAMARAVDHLERFRIRRGLGAPLVLLASLAIVGVVAALIGPSIRQQTRELSQELPKALQQVERWISQTPAKSLLGPPTQQPAGVATPPQGGERQARAPRQQQQQQGQEQGQQQGQEQGGRLQSQLGKELQNAPNFLFPVVSSVFGSIGGLIIVLFIAMYIAADPGLYREGMLHLVPHRNRGRAQEWLGALGDTLRQWLIARLIAMVIIGVLTGLGLALLQVKAAAALGVLAGVLEFVPFFGPIASAIPAIGIALVDSPQKALWVGGLYLLMQQLEGNVVTPLLLEKRLAIPPVMTVVAVSAMGMVFGVLGMLIAEPLMAVVLVSTKMLYVNNVIGDEVKIGKET